MTLADAKSECLLHSLNIGLHKTPDMYACMNCALKRDWQKQLEPRVIDVIHRTTGSEGVLYSCFYMLSTSSSHRGCVSVHTLSLIE